MSCMSRDKTTVMQCEGPIAGSTPNLLSHS